MTQDGNNTTPKKQYPSYLFGGKPGRPRGTPNKATQIQLEAARLAREVPGIDAQAFLLRVMRDENEDMDRRIDAAKAVLPTTHARLAAIKMEPLTVNNVNLSPDELYGRLVEILVNSGAINPKLLTKPVQMIEGPVPAGVEIEEDEDD